MAESLDHGRATKQTGVAGIRYGLLGDMSQRDYAKHGTWANRVRWSEVVDKTKRPDARQVGAMGGIALMRVDPRVALEAHIEEVRVRVAQNLDGLREVAQLEADKDLAARVASGAEPAFPGQLDPVRQPSAIEDANRAVASFGQQQSRTNN